MTCPKSHCGNSSEPIYEIRLTESMTAFLLLYFPPPHKKKTVSSPYLQNSTKDSRELLKEKYLQKIYWSGRFFFSNL